MWRAIRSSGLIDDGFLISFYLFSPLRQQMTRLLRMNIPFYFSMNISTGFLFQLNAYSMKCAYFMENGLDFIQYEIFVQMNISTEMIPSIFTANLFNFHYFRGEIVWQNSNRV